MYRPFPYRDGLVYRYMTVELHGFSDASQAALSAVVYLRVMNDLGEVRVSLISAKTKVAPQKSTSARKKRVACVTTPRLELTAATLLARHVSRVRNVINYDDIVVHL